MAWIAPLVVTVLGIVYVIPVSPAVPTGCDYRGQHYQSHHFQPHPCEHCICDNGKVACAVTDCPDVMCVDAVNDPKQCCPVCPNGPTCRYNGTIMKDGDAVSADAHTTCHCVPPHVLCLPNPIG